VERYLLDTDVTIDVSRGSLKAAAYVDSFDDVSISIITAQELIVGARGKRDVAAIESLISVYSIEHIDDAVGLLAYDLLKRYAKSDGLRTFDSLIASTAMARHLVLVTRNRRHFAMIEGLQIEVPLF
jgi:predicted nucleic acid-binding protein